MWERASERQKETRINFWELQSWSFTVVMIHRCHMPEINCNIWFIISHWLFWLNYAFELCIFYTLTTIRGTFSTFFLGLFCVIFMTEMEQMEHFQTKFFHQTGLFWSITHKQKKRVCASNHCHLDPVRSERLEMGDGAYNIIIIIIPESFLLKSSDAAFHLSYPSYALKTQNPKH